VGSIPIVSTHERDGVPVTRRPSADRSWSTLPGARPSTEPGVDQWIEGGLVLGTGAAGPAPWTPSLDPQGRPNKHGGALDAADRRAL